MIFVGTVARKLFMTPDSDVFTICCALDVLSVGSVVKSFIDVARTDRCRREVDEVFGIRLPVLRQEPVLATLRHYQQNNALQINTKRKVMLTKFSSAAENDGVC